MNKEKVGRKDKIYLGIYISESTKAELQTIAVDKELTVSGLMRMIVKEYLNKEHKNMVS